MPGRIVTGDGVPIDSQPTRAHLQYEPLRAFIARHRKELGEHPNFLMWLAEEGISGAVLLATADAIVRQELGDKAEVYVRAIIRNIIARADTDPAIFARLEENGWR